MSTARKPDHTTTDLTPTAEIDPGETAEVLRRLRRVHGQVAGLIRMVESGRDCNDVVTQLSAASHALHRVGFLLVAEEIRSFSTDPDVEPDPTAAARMAAVEKLFLSLA